MCFRNFDMQMAPILCVAAVEMAAEVTLKVSRHIVRGIALILCTAAVEMEAKATLKVSRRIV